MSKRKAKLRTSFRKNRQVRTRRGDWTRQYVPGANKEGFDEEGSDAVHSERISGKGELSRQRTVVGEQVETEDGGFEVLRAVDLDACHAGRVIAVRGLQDVVETEDGVRYHCATRRLLKTMSTDQRNAVVVGDRVLFRPVPTSEEIDEGIIERVEPRYGTISRTSRNRQHVLVANVDQLLVVTSVAEPEIKPHLIDRFLVTAEKSGIRPVVCINKIDLADVARVQPLVGVYSQLGYRVILVSATTGFGVDRLRRAMRGRQSAVAGQSGVGKSSLLNAVDEGLDLRTGHVSQESQKGRHTTTTAELFRLSFGGYVVDTPGIRQFQLWDVIPEEVAGFFRDLRPFVSMCRFPDCTHTHEEPCAVKDAAADGYIDIRRYESYLQIRANEEP